MNPPAAPDRELSFSRLIPAAPAKLFRAWTEPDLIEQWFCPRPWRARVLEADVHPGGASRITMHGPEGEEFASAGVYLEVVPNERLVFTDAYTVGWVPAEKPFMTGIITFTPSGDGTLYAACVRHWTVADREEHEARGFYEGWGKATDQLAELAAKI